MSVLKLSEFVLDGTRFEKEYDSDTSDQQASYKVKDDADITEKFVLLGPVMELKTFWCY